MHHRRNASCPHPVAALPGAGNSATVIGFAGDYCGYWVTPEEYDAQMYEGASTLGVTKKKGVKRERADAEGEGTAGGL